MSVPRIFDNRLRRMRRDRAAHSYPNRDFLYAAMAQDLLDRLDAVTRTFQQALVIGCPDRRLAQALEAKGAAVRCADPGAIWAARGGGAPIEEDRLPYPPGSFDLILCCGTLDSVNDLPGALIAMNRALVPDGLLLLSFVGAGSFARLREALRAGDGERPAQRIHPQVDVRALGDLMARAGFAMPVVDQQRLDLRYSSIFRLMDDLRGMGAAQCLASPPPPLTRGALAIAAETFQGAADEDGRVTETVMILHGSGWRASDTQPRPARRGSGQISLAQALRPGSATSAASTEPKEGPS